jgi:hypothetical protein
MFSIPFVLILHGTGRKENQYSLALFALGLRGMSDIEELEEYPSDTEQINVLPFAAACRISKNYLETDLENEQPMQYI